jgi:Cu-Zn family superoxide dismutase
MLPRPTLRAAAAATLLVSCTASPTTPLASTATLDAARSAGPSLAQGAAASLALRTTLHDATGAEVGFAQLQQDGAGRVHLTVHAKGLTPGLHGIHLHAVGSCIGTTTPAFSSAGGHYNPTGKEHGYHNPAGYHAGDLPNLVVNPAGVGQLTETIAQFQLSALLDADGTALVIHEREDDLTTNAGPFGPGNSGARLACGVLEAK